MLNLDTHILVRALEDTLTSYERRALTRDPEWSISDIVLWEITKLHQGGRIRYGLDYPPLAEIVEKLRVWPITIQVCRNLAALDFKSDPADELIAATSLTHKLTLVTRDERIRASRVITCL